MLAARGQINTSERICDGFLHTDFYTTDGIDDIRKSAHTDFGVVVNTNARCLLDGLCEQLRAAVGKGSVDLIGAESWHIDVAITWDTPIALCQNVEYATA